MSEDIKSLIAKINKEGIGRAQEEASKIESAAKKKSDEIITKAQKEASKIIAEAKEKVLLEDEKQKALLSQAARDLLLNLKEEINKSLKRIITTDVKAALKSEDLSKMILDIVKTYGHQIKGGIVISAKKEDIDGLGNHFAAKLKEEVKAGVTLKSSQEISGGFTISFDAGKSCFDFTDKALAEYIGSSLKPKLKELLDEAIKK